MSKSATTDKNIRMLIYDNRSSPESEIDVLDCAHWLIAPLKKSYVLEVDNWYKEAILGFLDGTVKK